MERQNIKPSIDDLLDKLISEIDGELEKGRKWISEAGEYEIIGIIKHLVLECKKDNPLTRLALLKLSEFLKEMRDNGETLKPDPEVN